MGAVVGLHIAVLYQKRETAVKRCVGVERQLREGLGRPERWSPRSRTG